MQLGLLLIRLGLLHLEINHCSRRPTPYALLNESQYQYAIILYPYNDLDLDSRCYSRLIKLDDGGCRWVLGLQNGVLMSLLCEVFDAKTPEFLECLYGCGFVLIFEDSVDVYLGK